MLTRLFFSPYFPPLSILPSLPHPVSCGIQNHPFGDQVGRGRETVKLEIKNNTLKKKKVREKNKAASSIPFFFKQQVLSPSSSSSKLYSLPLQPLEASL